MTKKKLACVDEYGLQKPLAAVEPPLNKSSGSVFSEPLRAASPLSDSCLQRRPEVTVSDSGTSRDSEVTLKDTSAKCLCVTPGHGMKDDPHCPDVQSCPYTTDHSLCTVVNRGTEGTCQRLISLHESILNMISLQPE